MQAERRREQLLTVARACFVAEGYAGTSVSAIVQAAGVAQGTFYVHFKSKQELLAELRRGVFARYAGALQGVQALTVPVEERLVRAVEGMVRILREELPLERVFREAESAEALQRAVQRGRARLAVVAQGLLEGGAFRVPDTEMFARVTVTIFDNLLYETLAYEDEAQLVRAATEGLRVVLCALGVPGPRIAALCATLDVSMTTTMTTDALSLGGG